MIVDISDFLWFYRFLTNEKSNEALCLGALRLFPLLSPENVWCARLFQLLGHKLWSFSICAHLEHMDCMKISPYHCWWCVLPRNDPREFACRLWCKMLTFTQACTSGGKQNEHIENTIGKEVYKPILNLSSSKSFARKHWRIVDRSRVPVAMHHSSSIIR